VAPKAPEGLGAVVSRRLDWPACQNTRDLGGLPRNGGLTRSRVLIRSDHLGFLNEAGREAMQAYGVTTVVDLRSESEVANNPSPFADSSAATYAQVALIDDKNMNNIGDSKDMFERYMYIVDTRPQAFRDVFNVLARSDGTVLFHCFAGKDRTGLVAAMLLAVAGVPREHIAADYGETDVQLAKQYEIWINEADPDKRDAFRNELRCPPERILGVLEHMDARWGGVESYLETAGMASADVDLLASRLA
jgi:protein-tyrosine phosphatase